jgi:hypothetical protein
VTSLIPFGSRSSFSCAASLNDDYGILNCNDFL